MRYLVVDDITGRQARVYVQSECVVYATEGCESVRKLPWTVAQDRLRALGLRWYAITDGYPWPERTP